jgi:FemAB-related protein (PEP-CTERM system-associated)
MTSVADPVLSETFSCHPLDGIDAVRWDEFVERQPHGTPFHLTAWKRTIEQSFGYRPCYLYVSRNGQIEGVLPLFLVQNIIIGKALISSPFAVYGGILASSDAARRELYAAAIDLGRRIAVDYIEFRNAWPEQVVGEPNVHRYVTFTQPVQPQDDEALLASLPKKTRNMVRKALKTPFTTRYNVRQSQVMHEVHSRNMRRLGTPNFPPRYFRNLLANFGERADIREVLLDGKPLAVSLNIYFNGEMHTYHAAADTRFKALAPNIFMYFDHIRWAGQNGFRAFDFGRSKYDTGVFEFKKHWNTTMRELPYEIVLIKRNTLPNFSPANPRLALVTKVWQRIPLPVARLLSPLVLPLFP